MRAKFVRQHFLMFCITHYIPPTDKSGDNMRLYWFLSDDFYTVRPKIETIVAHC